MSFALQVPGRTDGWLSRRDARWKIVAFAVLIAAAASLTDWRVAFLAAIASALLTLTAGVSMRTLLMRVIPVVGAIAFFFGWIVFVEENGPNVLGLVVAKTCALLTLAVGLFETTGLPEFGHGAAQLGAPKIFVHLMLLTHRYVFVLTEEFGRVRRALRVRGFRQRCDRRTMTTVGHVAGMLFVRGHERAERVHHAMAARGFDGVFRSLAGSRTTLADVVFVLAALLIAAAAVALDRGWLP